MTVIPDFPERLIDLHHAWHEPSAHPGLPTRQIRPPTPGSGLEFLTFHRDFMEQALDWYFAQPDADRGAVAAWTQVPAELKDPALGWDTTLADAEDRLTNDLFSFSSADALGQFVERGLHGFLHGAAARHYQDPVVGTLHSPASTLFYRIHRLVQLWWDRWEQRRPRARIWGEPSPYSAPVFDAARVVYRGTDDNIHELWLNGAVDRWQDANLGAQAGAPPADHAAFGSFNAAPHGYYTPLFDAARVVYRADDDHIHELWLTSQNGGWQHADLSSISGAAIAVGEPRGYYTPLFDAARVVYRGPDDHLHELWLTQDSGGWQHADLSAMTGAPRAWADPSPYYTPLFDAARVVYRGQDDHFHELWLTSDSGGWQHADLSAMTGAPPADHGWFGTFNAAPHGYYTPLFDAARVVYRGDDDHIHELWLTADSGGWQHADLSAQSGAPPAVGEPCGYYTPLFDAARVVYRGADQHVHELWLTADSGGWRHADLSAHADSGIALGDPRGYYTPVRGAARVVYRGEDDHVHELWLTADSGGWQHADLAG